MPQREATPSAAQHNTAKGRCATLHLLTCTKVRLANCEVQGADFEAITIDGCTDVSARDLIVDDATRLAPESTAEIIRAHDYDAGSWRMPLVMYGAVKVVNSSEVDIHHAKVSNCVRSGVVIWDSQHVACQHVRCKSCGTEGVTTPFSFGVHQDAGIVSIDSSDVTIRDCYALDCRVYGIETMGTIDLLDTHKVLIDNCFVRANPTTAIEVGSTAHAGIAIEGGVYQTVSNCEIANSGEESIHTNPQGVLAFRAISNYCHNAGRSDTSIHGDGLSIETAPMAVIAFNHAEDNPRNGIQVKSLHDVFSELPLHDVIVACNVLEDNGNGESGQGIAITSVTATTTVPTRTTLLANVVRGSFTTADIVIDDLSNDTQIVACVCSNARLPRQIFVEAQRTMVLGGMYHANETATDGCILVRAASLDTHVLGAVLIGVDPIREETIDITAIAATQDSRAGLLLESAAKGYVAHCFSAEHGVADVSMNAATARVDTAKPLTTFVSGVTGIGVLEVSNGWGPEWTTVDPSTFGADNTIWNSVGVKGMWAFHRNAAANEQVLQVAHANGAWSKGPFIGDPIRVITPAVTVPLHEREIAKDAGALVYIARGPTAGDWVEVGPEV